MSRPTEPPSDYLSPIWTFGDETDDWKNYVQIDLIEQWNELTPEYRRKVAMSAQQLASEDDL